MKIKICKKCKREKGATSFYKNKANKDGLTLNCRECSYIKVNHEERKCLFCKKQFKPISIKHLACGDLKCIAKRYKEYKYNKKIANHKIRNCPVCSMIFKPKKSYSLTCSRKCSLELYFIKNKNSMRISAALRSRIYHVINGAKSKSTMKLLGCSIDEFKSHLALTFQKGMSFENYGKWQVDHILPCSAFELQNSEEQEVCFHYTNLQALWAEDNQKKYNKLIY